MKRINYNKYTNLRCWVWSRSGVDVAVTEVSPSNAYVDRPSDTDAFILSLPVSYTVYNSLQHLTPNNVLSWWFCCHVDTRVIIPRDGFMTPVGIDTGKPYIPDPINRYTYPYIRFRIYIGDKQRRGLIRYNDTAVTPLLWVRRDRGPTLWPGSDHR